MCVCVFFFFKQKTAYEMRISDWSSDVCSSDLLDPTAAAAAAIDEIVYANVLEGLTRIDQSGGVMPGLAESWTVSDDGLTYRFRLREGGTFNDGTAFDSADVQFSLERAQAPAPTNEPQQSLETNATGAHPAPAAKA